MKKKIKNWLSEEEDGYKRKKRTLKRKMAKKTIEKRIEKSLFFPVSQSSKNSGELHVGNLRKQLTDSL
jgi:hypothetical protein